MMNTIQEVDSDYQNPNCISVQDLNYNKMIENESKSDGKVPAFETDRHPVLFEENWKFIGF